MFLPGRDVPWKRFFLDVKDEFERDQLDDVAGMLTFAGVLALFPFLLFALALGSRLVTPQVASALLDQAGPVLPPAVLTILRDRVGALVEHKGTGLVTIGALGALWAGSGGVAALMRALNTAYGVKERRPWWKVRIIPAIATLAGAGFVLVASALAFIAPVLAERIGPAAVTLVTWVRMPVAGLVLMLGVASAYRFLPDVEQRLKFLVPGSVVAVVLWILASLGFSTYAQHFGSYEVEYGALGGVIVLLLWMWITSLAILLGAEINAVLEHRSPEGKSAGERTLDGATAPKPEAKPRDATEKSPATSQSATAQTR